MKRFILSLIVLILSVGLAFSAVAAHASAEPSKPDQDKEKTYLVGFKNSDRGLKKAENSGKIKHKYKHLPFISVIMPSGKVKEFQNDPDILFMEPDGDVKISEAYPWNISQIKADLVQGQAMTGQGIKIAILDTGIDSSHEDLRVAGGAFFTGSSGSYLDDNGHGTHVAGVIAALLNGRGTIGASPEAQLYAVKVIDKYGQGSYSQVIAAIDWAIENKINIVCMSFGGDQPSQALELAMQKAYDNGILLVAAAGNENAIQYPAKFPSVIAVGAVDRENRRASFSAMGPELELVAPGVDIESTLPGNSYGDKSGTSVSSPHVAGAAALVWSARPGMTNAQVRDLLKQTAQPLGDNDEYGCGLVDPAAALGIEQPQVDFPPDNEEIVKINYFLRKDPVKTRAVAAQCLFSGNPDTRLYAARVLGEIGEDSDLEYLHKVRDNDSVEVVKNQASLSIEKIQARMTQEEGSVPELKDQSSVGDMSSSSNNPDDGMIRLLSFNRQGDGQTIAPGENARVSCQLYEGHSRVEIRVYKASNPSSTIASKTIYNTDPYETISYTWYSSSSTSPGTYKIRFHYPDNDSDEYDDIFTIYVEEDSGGGDLDQYEPNDSRSSATRIYLDRSYTAYIESSDDEDYYKFTPNASGTLTFNMDVPSGVDYDVELQSSSGNVLEGGYRGTGRDESFTHFVTSGTTYYICVYSCSGYGSQSYRISTTLTAAANDNYEPNNTTNTATPIQLNQSYSAYIGYSGDNDYYRINPGVNGRLSFEMTLPDDIDYDVELLNSSGSRIAISDGTTSTESFTCDLAGGSTYYIRIYGFSGAFNVQEQYQFSTTYAATRASLDVSVSAPGQVNSAQTFTVTATVSNTASSVTANSVTAAISLPDGLQLTGGQGTVSLGSINADSNRSVSWTVKAGNFSSTVSKTFTVTASASNADAVQQSKTLTIQKKPISGSDATEDISEIDDDGRGESRCGDPIDTATGSYILERTLLRENAAQPLSFRVRYNSLLLLEGPLGKGWGHDFEVKLAVLANGNIDVQWTANRVNHFTGNGSLFTSTDLATRFDTLVKNADGSYTLTRKDQSVYLFNSAGKLTEQKNGHGQRLTMTYDGSGRLTKVTEPVSGKYLTLSYNVSGLLQSVSDNSGRTVSFTHDGSRNLTSITDAAGNTKTYAYNADGRLLTIADAGGVRITNAYDAQGRVIAQDDAVGGNQLDRFNYDETTAPGQIITTVTSRKGTVQVYTHDSKYQLLSVKDELGNTETYTYDSNGNRITETDAASRTTTCTFDSRGNLLTVTNPAGHVTRISYDERNNLLSVENAAGKRITFIYDTNNNPLSITDPLGNTTSLSYDSNGLMTSRTVPGSGTTTYSYQNGLLHSVTSPEGSTTTFSNDAAGRMTGAVDSAGNTTRMTYDSTDNLLSVTDPLGNTYRFTYDSHHNRLTETDPRGNITRFEYNSNNNLTSTVDALGNRTGYEYDGDDQLVRVTNARGSSTTLVRNAKGRVTSVTDSLGRTTTYEYNAVDNPVGQRDALGNRILSISYDVLNNPVTATNAVGNTVTNQYNVLNRVTAVTDPLGRTTQFGYDNLNRLVSTTNALGGRSSQTFDTAGNWIALTDASGNRTTFNFDRAGRLTAETLPWGSTVSYQYNSRNLVSRITNGRGQSASLQYDAAGRLTSLNDPDGTVSYTYDANGNVLTVSDSNGTITRKYDALNRVTEYTDTKGNTLRYSYDTVSNLTALTYPDGKQVHYDYNTANRMTRVTDWAGRAASYEYDANSRLVRTTRPNGTVETRSYDTAGRLIRQSDIDRNGSIISQYDFAYDAAGNVTAEQSAVPTLPFSLDNAAMTYTSGNRLATFNSQSVSYDADGNMTTGPLAGQMVSYVYDASNRLMSAGSLSYRYDAENNRISVTDSVYNMQTTYVINPNAPLSQVLIKTDSDGNQTFYIYGLGLIGQETNGTYTTYHFDLRGSTVALTDAGGNVTDRFQYAPYGEMVKRTGSISTPFLYSGRYGVMADGNGLYYMRARYYNPENRRFVNQDPITGSAANSQSLNRFAYVKGSPVSHIDPLGLWGWDVHYVKTFDIAYEILRDENIAKIIGKECYGVDWNPAINPGLGQSWHFDTNQNQEGIVYNKPEDDYKNDSRMQHYREELDNAVMWYNAGFTDLAYESLGRGLHALQDIDAHIKWYNICGTRIHGTWDDSSPDWNPDPRVIYPNPWSSVTGSESWSMGYLDDVNRDYNYETGEWFKVFPENNNRLNWTLRKTRDALREFKRRTCP